ncbi:MULTISPECIES: SDR family oxidoreductase [unclassified Mucilaginibacter]|uniref:SDR family oxidoreductase n=1 Tax=unclassified Mucilaginibacter TaxID=2617802 RepID=UPI002AC8B529|nr:MULTISPECIES: SDR family oxidoreductase [unclassified Mucilaginibacter]MEB0280339.1 SDR family oxidoreductase [Mucilaginibacter sp. 10B2]MEB0300360.1 SDR family oxidoreductase [Mucilaginibacter sp. 5C4]WPX24570.1 SDR family oxidoreductase [Mucilaginibacter sp. 5C4]
MKNALITAATKGIGRAVSIAFAKQGINLSICSRNEQDLLNFKQELQGINPQITVITMVTDCSKRDELINFAVFTEKKLGFVDIIVNNVGMYKHVSILNDSEDSFQKQIDTNLLPAYELYRFFGKTMVSVGKGHIFNICSVAAINPVVEAGMYSVTKYALLGLNKVMRLETQGHGVKVTAVIPGSTLTDSWNGIEVDKNTMVLPEDVASAIVNILNMSAGANVDEVVIKPAPGQI